MTLIRKWNNDNALVSHNGRQYAVDWSVVRVYIPAKINRRNHSRVVSGPLASQIKSFVATQAIA